MRLLSLSSLGAMLAILTGVVFAAPPRYAVIKTLSVDGAGGYDLITVDPQTHRLFVPRGTHTLVIDPQSGKTLADIPGQKRAHGVAIVPKVNRGFISDGGTGFVVVFDLTSYQVLGRVRAAADADDITYDPASNRVLVACGDPGLMILIKPDIDLKSGQADPPIDLGGKPEGIALDGQGKAYVNLVNRDQVAVIDTQSMKVLHHWMVAPGGAPVGMAIDREHERLFIGCRKPQKMVVMDSDDGKVLADLPIGAGNDGAAFDNGLGFASCRDGTLTAVGQSSSGQFQVAQIIKTVPGARTCAVDPQTHLIYLPAAQFEPLAPGRRWPKMKPDTFEILAVGPAAPQ